MNAAALLSGSYSEPANSNTLTVNSSGGPGVGGEVYLDILSGPVPSGIYTVTGAPDSNHFTVATSATASAALGGSVIVPKMTAYVYVTRPSGSSASQLSMTTSLNANLNVGDTIWLATGAAFELHNAQFTIATVLGPEKYTLVNATIYTNTTSPQSNMYPLVPPVLSRSGTVAMPSSNFNMGNTNGSLAQTPLDSPTVFNFFYPNYQYPGTLAAGNVTTPEFQLTTDTNIITLTNTVASTILSSGNTKGLSNFQNGAVNLDLSAYMGAPYVSVTTASVTSGTKVTATTTTTVDATALVAKLGEDPHGRDAHPGVAADHRGLPQQHLELPALYHLHGHHRQPARSPEPAHHQRAGQGPRSRPGDPRLARILHPAITHPHGTATLLFPAHPARIHPAGALRRRRHRGAHQHDPRPAFHQLRHGAVREHHHRLQGAGVHLPGRRERFQ